MFSDKSNAARTLCLSLFMMVLILSGFGFHGTADASSQDSEYSYWQSVGRQAAEEAVKMFPKGHFHASSGGYIALSNAGYAEVDDQSTMAALDGLVDVLNVRRGDHSLVEVHSASGKVLWFAIYQPQSGYCVYLEYDPDAVDADDCNGHPFGKGKCDGGNQPSLFSTVVSVRIDADYLYENPDESAETFESGIFNGNEFRIVTIANAVALGAPSYVIRSFELHDHFCPGVTSGIIYALYLKSFLPLDTDGSYFVQTVQPWCKEDALISMLNTTPGKKGYAVTYATDEDVAAWPDWANGSENGGITADTIIYRQSSDGVWDGVVLGFSWADLSDTCSTYSNSILSKLCMDIYYMERLDIPEDFVVELTTFELPDGGSPKDYARPGVDAVMAIDALLE